VLGLGLGKTTPESLMEWARGVGLCLRGMVGEVAGDEEDGKPKLRVLVVVVARKEDCPRPVRDLLGASGCNVFGSFMTVV
jgi:hypothetical protein